MNGYPDRLDQAWQAHLSPRAVDAPTVVSLFAGGGGSSLGYLMAGYRELLAVEWDGYAVATFRANFPDVPVYHGDIGGLSDDRCLELAGIGVGELDVLDGSPPCQGFSTGAKRRLDDPRNGLFREYVRLLQGLRPKALMMENVAGLVRGKLRLVFAKAVRALKESGYLVSARLLDAKWFGVPQCRARLIVVGVRSDLGIPPSHPKAQGWPPTVREALAGVENEPAPELSPKYHRLAPLIRPGQSEADLSRGTGFQNLVRLSFDRPAPTIAKLNGGTGRGTPLHPVYHRSLTIPEAKRLCSFPGPFVLPDAPFAARWGVLGNAVPPLFMRAIATHVDRHILQKIGGDAFLSDTG